MRNNPMVGVSVAAAAVAVIATLFVTFAVYLPVRAETGQVVAVAATPGATEPQPPSPAATQDPTVASAPTQQAQQTYAAPAQQQAPPAQQQAPPAQPAAPPAQPAATHAPAAPAAPANPPVTTDPLPAPAPAPTGPLGRRLVGRWAGPVTGDATSYSVEVSISNGDPVAGVVRYPELPCSGTWAESSGVSNASGVYVTETITQGTDRCIAQVQLLLVPEGNTVRMHIFTTRTGHRPEAVLSRR